MRRVVAGLGTALGLVLMALLSAQPASAHADEEGSTPRNGAVVRTAPASIAVRFGEVVTIESTRILGPDGAVQPAKSQMDGSSLVLTPEKPLPRGPITASWKVRSDDGHVVGGSIAFINGPRTATGAAQRLTAFPRIPVRLSGSAPGQLTITFAKPGTGGSIAWTSPAILDPITWPIVADGTTVAGRGVLPLPGTWTYAATVTERDGSVLIVKGSAVLGARR